MSLIQAAHLVLKFQKPWIDYFEKSNFKIFKYLALCHIWNYKSFRKKIYFDLAKVVFPSYKLHNPPAVADRGRHHAAGCGRRRLWASGHLWGRRGCWLGIIATVIIMLIMGEIVNWGLVQGEGLVTTHGYIRLKNKKLSLIFVFIIIILLIISTTLYFLSKH